MFEAKRDSVSRSFDVAMASQDTILPACASCSVQLVVMRAQLDLGVLSRRWFRNVRYLSVIHEKYSLLRLRGVAAPIRCKSSKPVADLEAHLHCTAGIVVLILFGIRVRMQVAYPVVRLDCTFHSFRTLVDAAVYQCERNSKDSHA